MSSFAIRRVARAAKWTPAGVYSTLVGWGARATMPRRLRRPFWSAFAKVVGADIGEAELDLADYRSLGDFFARRLRQGSRQVEASPPALVSPCDGRVAALGAISDGTLLQAKGKTFSVAELLADPARAVAFDGGSYCIVYLAPRDYHRVHTPWRGTLVGYQYIPGSRWPVSERFAAKVDGLFARNERIAIHLDTPEGPLAVVMVAAVGVGNMWLSHLAGSGGDTRALRSDGETVWRDAPGGIELGAGDELGAFHLGSTVVVLTSWPAHLAVETGQAVRFGQRLGTVVGAT